MVTIGVDVLDKSVQDVTVWLNEVQERLETKDRQQAYRALKATLHAVRDRVGDGNAAHLGAQLPLMIKGIYYDGWRPGTAPSKERTRERFMAHVDDVFFRGLGMDPERAVKATLEVLCEHIDAGEARKLEGLFPEELRGIWPIHGAAQSRPAASGPMP